MFLLVNTDTDNKIAFEKRSYTVYNITFRRVNKKRYYNNERFTKFYRLLAAQICCVMIERIENTNLKNGNCARLLVVP